MQDLFTWNILATYAGAVLATALVTQMLKNIPGIQKLPTRVFSYIVAFIILILAAIFTDTLSLSTVLLTLLNAALVSFASNGAFDASRMGRLKGK